MNKIKNTIEFLELKSEVIAAKEVLSESFIENKIKSIKIKGVIYSTIFIIFWLLPLVLLPNSSDLIAVKTMWSIAFWGLFFAIYLSICVFEPLSALKSLLNNDKDRYDFLDPIEEINGRIDFVLDGDLAIQGRENILDDRAQAWFTACSTDFGHWVKCIPDTLFDDFTILKAKYKVKKTTIQENYQSQQDEIKNRIILQHINNIRIDNDLEIENLEKEKHESSYSL